MERNNSEIFARKILDAAKGYTIEPNWKAESYKEKPEELIDELIESVATDLKNDPARDEADKFNMMNDLTEKMEGAIINFEEEHGKNMLQYKQQIKAKKEAFAFNVFGS